MKMRAPSYLELHKKGKLAAVKERLLKGLEHCELCPRNCKVNRLKGELGFCKTGRRAAISSFNLHFGEEPPLVGRGGSGTIFFTWCNLGCIYCQNYSISHSGEGSEIDTDKLASIMLYLQKEGAHNINFVTPSHVIAQIIEALIPAVEKGLRLPLVYNSGGYDKRAILKELEGIFDIYMPDAKYSDEHYSFKYSSSKDYWPVCKDALQEMHRQVGDLLMDASGITERGLLIRHLVLPKRIAGSFEVLDFIANKISKDSYVNIMDQYYPCFKGHGIEELSRRVTPEEFEEVVEHAREVGLHRGF
jgi:putative pyruvate formate lyase activating enzyme